MGTESRAGTPKADTPKVTWGRKEGLYLHLCPLGRRDFGIIHFDFSLGHLIEALQDDAQGLTHLLHAAQVAVGQRGLRRGCGAGVGGPGTGRDVPVVAVTPGADGDIKFHLVIDVVGLRLT